MATAAGCSVVFVYLSSFVCLLENGCVHIILSLFERSLVPAINLSKSPSSHKLAPDPADIFDMVIQDSIGG